MIETPNPVQTPGNQIGKDDEVARVLGRYPQTLGVFHQFGIASLKDPAARQGLDQATIERAAKEYGADLASLLGALNKIRAAVDVSSAATTVSLPITKSHLVGEVTEAFPATLDVFLKHGFDHLADESMRRTVARTVTIEMAGTIHGIDISALLAELNAAAGSV